MELLKYFKLQSQMENRKLQGNANEFSYCISRNLTSEVKDITVFNFINNQNISFFVKCCYSYVIKSFIII